MSGSVHRGAKYSRAACVLSVFLLVTAHGMQVGIAAPGVPTIVLESHVGQRSPEVAAAIAPVLDELERLGFAARPKSITRLLRGRAPLPGRQDEGKTLADIKQLIALGRSAFDKAKFTEAETSLRNAVELIRRNPALLVLDTNNERVTYGAFVSLALTLMKLKRASEATDVMLELLRMSSTPIPQAEYGPKAEEIHSNAEQQAQAMGRGSLTIAVDDSRTMIFLDQKFRGMGKVSLGDLIAGPHHVLVQVPGTGGLQYVRTVQANQASTLDISWQLESMLHVDDSWAGIVFASEIEHEREAVYASDLAHRLGGADVIVIGTMVLNGVSYVVGTQYPANGDPPIGAFAPVNAGEGLLRALATYLYDGTMAAGLRVLPRGSEGTSPTVAIRNSTVEPRSTLLPKLAMGAGALAITIGAVAYVRKPYDPTMPAIDDGRDPVVGVMLGGSVVLGGGVYLWVREARSASPLTAALLGAGVAGITAGTELYLTDQDPRPDEPRFIRNSAPAGVAFGVSGIALTGLGLWLLHREGSDVAPGPSARPDGTKRLAPTVSVNTSRAVVGFAGVF